MRYLWITALLAACGEDDCDAPGPCIDLAQARREYAEMNCPQTIAGDVCDHAREWAEQFERGPYDAEFVCQSDFDSGAYYAACSDGRVN